MQALHAIKIPRTRSERFRSEALPTLRINQNNNAMKKKLREAAAAFHLPSFDMLKLKTLLLTALSCAAASTAGAVALGDITMTSQPGSPMEATLQIDDIDYTKSPILVRIAPPATYIREGVEWPNQARDLFIAKAREPQGLKLQIIGESRLEGSFPLLIELNVGGSVTVRRYDLIQKDDKYVVSYSKEVPASYAAADESANEKPASEEAPAVRKKRRTTYAPRVVKEYVAVHGFDPAKPFVVQRDMTLWSVVRLYAPNYPESTMDQLVSAFAAKNPKAFINSDPAKLVVGAELVPPTREEAAAIDPMEAFRLYHGESEPVPDITSNLIKAQAVSSACAAAVGRAQIDAKEAGRGVSAAAAAGSGVLASEVCRAAPVEGGQEAPVDSAESSADLKPESAASQDDSSLNDAAQEAASEAVEHGGESVQAEQPPGEPAGPAVDTNQADMNAVIEEKIEEADVLKNAEHSEDNLLWWLIGIAAAAVAGLLVLAGRRRKEPEPESKPSGGVVSLQRDVPPSSPSQIAALKATVDECVKNGTTAGAMGAGIQTFTEERMKEERAAAVDQFDDEAEVTEEDIARKLESINLDLDSEEDPKKEAKPLGEDDVPAFDIPQFASDESSSADPRDKARWEALDAKIKLAATFAGMGAVGEAEELLDEVVQNGSPSQKEKALEMKARLKA